jgi:SUMO ligase MMS21 Smc5/6 complex component
MAAVAEPLATLLEFRLLGTNHLLEAYVCQTMRPSIKNSILLSCKIARTIGIEDKVAMV